MMCVRALEITNVECFYLSTVNGHCIIFHYMKVNEGAISNVSIYENNSYMVLEYRKLEYNKELKFFKLKFCVTFLIKIIHISSIFFYET